jgi:tRNA(Ile)-lysidine synthetase-like protein
MNIPVGNSFKIRPAPDALVLTELRKHLFDCSGQGLKILAVSGGVDSMVLLEAMARVFPEPAERGRLLVAHVNHGLRGEESDGDERFVVARARVLGLRCRVFRLEWKNEKPSQERCRRRREEIFSGLRQGPNDRVYLAHHLNDQAETLMLRLIRGTGARGLAGMLPASGFKIRPFLSLEKEILRKAAAFWGMAWREDSSNQDGSHYDRNWLRRHIFPLIEERRPGFQGRLAALAEDARGWAAVAPLAQFPYAEGIAFSRPGPKCSEAVLHETFGLPRLHCRELGKLLAKPSGTLEAKGARFCWSAGVLLVERGRKFEASLRALGSGLRLESSLGRWSLEEGGGGELLPLELRRGEYVKKEFQALRVPVFFREAVPLLRRGGRPVALLPKRLAGRAGIRFSPSPLARWWLNSSV